MKLLIIEDESALNASIVAYLQQGGYTCETAEDFREAWRKIINQYFDCVIVDLTLPGGNGLDLIRLLNTNDPEAGIIIISAKNALDDKITGLGIGGRRLPYQTLPPFRTERATQICHQAEKHSQSESNKIRQLRSVPRVC